MCDCTGSHDSGMLRCAVQNVFNSTRKELVTILDVFLITLLLLLLNCCFLGQRDTVRNDYLSLVLIFNLKSRLSDIQPQNLEKNQIRRGR